MKTSPIPTIIVQQDLLGRPIVNYQSTGSFPPTFAGVLSHMKAIKKWTNEQLASWLILQRRTVENYLQGRPVPLAVIMQAQHRLASLEAGEQAFADNATSLPMPPTPRSGAPTDQAPVTTNTVKGKRVASVPRRTIQNSVEVKGGKKAKVKGGEK
jgi:hypothetical protein